MPLAANGLPTTSFLEQYFEKGGKNRPELGVGFKALRRTELLKLGDLIKMEIVPRDMPAREMVIMIIAAARQGKFDHLVKEGATHVDAEVADLKKQVADLTKLVTGSAKPAAPTEAKPAKKKRGGMSDERKQLMKDAGALGWKGLPGSNDALRAFIAEGGLPTPAPSTEAAPMHQPLS